MSDLLFFLGPIEGLARATGKLPLPPKSLLNGYTSSMAAPVSPSKSERLNSPNTSKWEPDVRMLLSTSQWLKVSLNISFLPLIQVILKFYQKVLLL